MMEQKLFWVSGFLDAFNFYLGEEVWRRGSFLLSLRQEQQFYSTRLDRREGC